MFIPIGTDNPLRKSPTANYVLIFLNFAIFFVTHQPHVDPSGHLNSIRHAAALFQLDPSAPQLHQFVTYAFLHAGWMHILGNMLFLYIFGNNVNDKLGGLGYLMLYLGGAVFSGLGHCLVSDSRVLGASGAVATITGAYMVLFPKTYINVLYVLFFIGSVEVPAIWFIMFKLIIYDNVIAPKIEAGAANIAYSAHLAGYLYGVAIPLALLIFKILPHSHYDLWAMVKRWKRRKEFNSTVNSGYNPFQGTFARRKASPVDLPPDALQQKRAEIGTAIYQADLETAARLYLELIQLDSQQTLPQQQQLDIANKLAQNENYRAAAGAYELFIKAYGSYPRLEQVHLMLGWIYSRYLKNKNDALKYLKLALNNLTDTSQIAMCRNEIERLEH